MIDNELTQNLEAWLSKPSHDTDEDILHGAKMLLQLNRNRVLYQTVITRPKRFVATIDYELRKFLPMRKRGQTLDEADHEAEETLSLVRTVISEEPAPDANEAVLPAHGGQRPDHDRLPDDIKAIWEQNAERWKKIKRMYNTCLGFDKACDRAETAHALKETWYKYKSEFARYDDYELSDTESTVAADKVVTAKDVNNAKSYISKALKDGKLSQAKQAAISDNADDKAVKAYADLLGKVQQRVDVLLANHEVIGDELRQRLIDGGVSFPEASVESAKGNENNDEIDPFGY